MCFLFYVICTPIIAESYTDLLPPRIVYYPFTSVHYCELNCAVHKSIICTDLWPLITDLSALIDVCTMVILLLCTEQSSQRISTDILLF